MRVNKISSSFRQQVDDPRYKDVDKDLINIITAMQGRLRFGDGADGVGGENISGQFQQFTSDAVADTEFAVSHTMGSIPIGYIIIWQNIAGILYQGPTTGTAWTSSNIYLKCNVSSVTFKVFLIK